MKSILLVLLCVTLYDVTVAQQLSNTKLQSLVNAERAFSQLAKDKSTREAFLANLTAESISFSPGITAALKFWEQQPENEGWLYWQPVYADISASEEFGYTTGPWSYHKTKLDTAIACGEYITVWRKQVNGQWKVLIDAGISHRPIPVDGHVVKTSAIRSSSGTRKASSIKSVIETDNSFNQLLADDSLAYQNVASPEIKIYRDGMLPFSKLADIRTKINTRYKNVGIQISSGGDMAFTYGTVETTSADKKTAGLRYLRIWKKENGMDWKLVIDLIA